MAFTINDRICDDEGNALYGREYDLWKACKKLGIHIKTYKAWEKKGFIPPARKNPITGYRVLMDDDIEAVRKFIQKRAKEPRSRLGINKEKKKIRFKEHGELESLGKLIRKHRADSSLLARELGELIEVTEDTILNWEKNRTRPGHEQLLLLQEHLKIDPFAIVEFDGTISERERDIFELVKERESVTCKECQIALGLRQRDAQNGLYFLYKLGVLNRELGVRNTARYFLME